MPDMHICRVTKNLPHPVHTFQIKVKHNDTLPSCFSFCTVNNCPFHSLCKATFLPFCFLRDQVLPVLLRIKQSGLIHRHSDSTLQPGTPGLMGSSHLSLSSSWDYRAHHCSHLDFCLLEWPPGILLKCSLMFLNTRMLCCAFGENTSVR